MRLVEYYSLFPGSSLYNFAPMEQLYTLSEVTQTSKRNYLQI